MSKQKAVHDIEAAIEVIHASAEQYFRGYERMYLPISVELRKLVCDGDSTLVPRVFDDFTLHWFVNNVPGNDPFLAAFGRKGDRSKNASGGHVLESECSNGFRPQ